MSRLFHISTCIGTFSFLLCLVPAMLFGQEEERDGTEEKKVYEGKVNVQYMPMERFIFLKREGAVEDLEEGYLLSKGPEADRERKYLVHNDLEEALKERPANADKDKLFILYYEKGTPDPQALQEKYDIKDIELSSDDIGKKQRTLNVEEGEVKE